jgi:DNA-binding response OmpR family regulator
MTLPGQSLILLVGHDSALEYLLRRYARESGCEIRAMRENEPELDWRALRPVAVWFSSLDVLAGLQPLRAAIANETIPVVACSAVADDVRALELGADYFFLHPLTYDGFLTTLAATKAEPDKKESSFPLKNSSTTDGERIRPIEP